MKIAILGAGIVGSSFAHELARRGADVTLIDRGPPGQGTSGTSATYLNFFRKQPEHYGRLHVEAIAQWRRLVVEIGAEGALHLDGNLYWAKPDESLEVLEARAAFLGEPVTQATREALAPQLTPPLEAPARLVHGEGWVEVAPVIERLVASATAHGLRTAFGAPVVAIERRQGRLVLQTEGASIEADRLVIAAGPQTEEVGRLLGLSLPVNRKPGVIAITSPLPRTLKHVVSAPGLSFRPEVGNRVLIAVGERFTVPQGGWTAEERETLEASLLAALRAWVPSAREVRIESLRTGVRPIPADDLPLVGFLPGLPEVYLAVSHSAINLGPLFGRLGSGELLGGGPSPWLAPYRPQRLLGC